MPEEVNSIELAKSLASSAKVNNFIHCYLPTQLEQVVFMVSRGDNNKLLYSVFWRLPDISTAKGAEDGTQYYVSVSGAVVRRVSSTKFALIGRILDDQSAQKLAEVFKGISAAAADEDPFFKTNMQLLQSLQRQAGLFIESAQDSRAGRLSVYFQHAVVVGTREYPLFIFEESLLIPERLTTEAASQLLHPAAGSVASLPEDPANSYFTVDERIERVRQELLSPNRLVEVKVDAVRALYASLQLDPQQTARAEDALFLDAGVYAAVFSSRDADDAMQDELLLRKLHQLESVQLLDLTGPPAPPQDHAGFDCDALAHVLASVDDARTASAKLALLREICVTCATHDRGTSGADCLLPRLSFLLIRARPPRLHSNLRFVQRFASPAQITGEAVYVMTNWNAVLEVIDGLVRERCVPALPDDKSLYNLVAGASSAPTGPFASMASSVMSSIGQVPKAIGQAVASGFTRKPGAPGALEAPVLPASAPLDHHKYSPHCLPPPTQDLIDFRERLLATNSINDLQVRDLPVLLEDYKNLLFILLRPEHHQ